jgi:hypothetical protein
MKLKIKFAKETRFDLPCRPMIRPWTQVLYGTPHTMRSLAMAEWQNPFKRRVE